MSRILIIDDDHYVCRTLVTMVRQQGHEAECAQTLGDGLTTLEAQPVDLVLLDVLLPDGNGLDAIPAITQSPSNPEIVIMTAQGDPDSAELAIHRGAWDYVEKAASPKMMVLRIQHLLEHRANIQKQKPDKGVDRCGIVGTSRILKQALDQVAHSANSDAGVLITGETGTGKELFAQAVHRNSQRRKCNLVVVDCAALPKTLVESMLFGHVKGAFTGADGPRDGLVLQADGSTLFLDEVGEMPLDIQKSFLRVLESRRFRPIGAKRELVSNFRVVSSTNRDLDEMVEKGAFRQDLLHRLRTFHLILPPLRDRQDDISELCRFHLDRLCALYGWGDRKISAELLDLLQTYDWPGNVRELVNTMEYALATARHETVLYSHHLPARLRAQVARRRIGRPAAETGLVQYAATGCYPLPSLQIFRERVVDKAEADYLGTLMSATQGNIPKACSLSGISRSRLYELLKKHAIGPN